jgi:hypothetical protein
MLTGPHVITNRSRILGNPQGDFFGADPWLGQQLIDRCGFQTRKELTVRVCPAIFLGTGKSTSLPLYFFGISAKPVWKVFINPLNRFPKSAPAQCRPPTAKIVENDHWQTAYPGHQPRGRSCPDANGQSWPRGDGQSCPQFQGSPPPGSSPRPIRMTCDYKLRE